MPTDDVGILTAQIREEIYYSLISHRLFPEEQKQCRKRTRGTGDLLYFDQHILKESKTRRKNLAMALIDNKKAYDMVLQSWIIDCLKMYKIFDIVIKFIEKTMKNWSGTDCRRKKFNWGKNPERYIPRRCTIAITICDGDDAIQIPYLGSGQADTNFIYRKTKIYHLM